MKLTSKRKDSIPEKMDSHHRVELHGLHGVAMLDSLGQQKFATKYQKAQERYL
jgi:hypothetical protein